MNPVTRALLRQLNDASLNAFAEDWDALETLIVDINKQESISFAQQEGFFDLQARLKESYRSLATTLKPFWQKAKVKGELLADDPYAEMITAQSAQYFLENWPAMQRLPAAREALNEMLIERIEGS